MMKVRRNKIYESETHASAFFKPTRMHCLVDAMPVKLVSDSIFEIVY